MTASRLIALSFVVSMVASIALVAFYFIGESTQVEGALLALALGSLGLGIIGWAASLMSEPERSEEREPLSSGRDEMQKTKDVINEQEVTRRSMLVRLLAGAGTTLAAALAVPALTLGPRPGQTLFGTKWTPGARVVDFDNNPVRPEDLPVEGVVTVFPENFVDSADSQTVIVKVATGLLESSGERADWSPGGCIAYSKICTHAGCPIGLYRAEAHQLLCPCHQSTFNVLEGAEPVFGPAARPLPQLPLDVDDGGYLIARSDYLEPVGPSFWNMTGAGE